jgi:hypothetical protein
MSNVPESVHISTFSENLNRGLNPTQILVLSVIMYCFPMFVLVGQPPRKKAIRRCLALERPYDKLRHNRMAP